MPEMLTSLNTSLAIVAAYLWFVVQGPKTMKDRRPFDLKLLISSYNCLQILINIHIVYLCCSLLGWRTLDFWSNVCGPVSAATDDPAQGQEVAFIHFYFYLNKIFDLLDTVFFILRKKEAQVTLFHVFHHSSLVLFFWMNNFIMTEELTVHLIVVNAAVHVIMHVYYLMSSFGSLAKYLWWKRHISNIQFVEFFLLLSMLIKTKMDKCHVHPYYVDSWLAEISINVILFLQFYRKAYLSKKK